MAFGGRTVELWPVEGEPAAERKIAGEERKCRLGLGFPEMETLNPQFTIYRNFFPNFHRP
jgi:hypothetical protein